MSECTQEADIRAIQKSAWDLRKSLHQKQRAHDDQEKVRSGGVITRSRKLHKIKESFYLTPRALHLLDPVQQAGICGPLQYHRNSPESEVAMPFSDVPEF